MALTRRSPVVARLSGIDRRAGAALRRRAARRAALGRGAQFAARITSPAFRVAVAAMVLNPRTRAAGLRALVAGVAAALLARAARDRIGRRRPGVRAEGGFPSRHAAAAAAIAHAVARTPGSGAAGALLGVAAVAGVTGRVASAEHEPADIAAGALLGVAVAEVTARAMAGR